MQALSKVDPALTSTVRILLVEPDVQLRNSLRHILMSAGFRNVLDYGSLEKLKETIELETPDLLFIDAHTPGGDACELVHRLRFGEEGRNPFLSVILTVWQSKIESLDKLINSGVDHIILKPVSPQTILARIEALIERRKPFVATSHYIGPDRRKDPRAESQIPTFDVPNTLKVKTSNRNFDMAQIQREIDRALTGINGEMVHRLAFQLAYQAENLSRLSKGSQTNYLGPLKELKWSLVELLRRLDSKGNDQIFQAARSLGDVYGRIDAVQPTQKDIDLLRKLAVTINLGLKNAASEEELLARVGAALEKSKQKAGGR
jgi:DNA-binding response OmpR family regulator